ncbi:hypothetical protein B0T22DRAFT_530810 [Podospora appendiculata]|uniref:Zinc finger Mcm10/DnaG-type domain-containing protein n=1 Tax=Podospora appendiculata TaxID=314037 RepID=A0AAE1C873_9PEZI|nr:hypothetical protein B0T22DRAFT_530810 [Podospora appendiculata]
MASQWPPRSPGEALLGTPGGRERMRRLAERGSPTPSPSKSRSTTSARFAGAGSGGGGSFGESLDDEMVDGDDDDDEDEDDEEMLELKLQAIQAKMKLKKLQAAKAQKRSAPGSAVGAGGQRPESAPVDSGGMRGLPVQSKLAAVRDRIERPPSHSIEVPASPVRKQQNTANLQTSPQRILLGIDKGRRAADMSLKRAPSLRTSQEDRFGQQGNYLRRLKTPLNGQTEKVENPRPLTFNERLASVKAEEVSRQERQQRIQQIRTTAFNVGKAEMEDYKNKAVQLSDLPYRPQEFSRDDILGAVESASGGQIPRSKTAPDIQLIDRGESSTTIPVNSADAPDSEASFEPYSGLHLSKRILPHKVLARTITGKKCYVLKDLLRHVKAPDWSLPDVESDIVVFAIIAGKSDPRSHRPGPAIANNKVQQDRGKYMVLTLVDLSYEVELFLFNTGFDRFWKLTPGTVLAILNPTILPPPPGREATNRFGLVINSDADTILEIGNARDLGYCKSVKKDGQLCKSWVNARHSEHCEFHTNEAIRKTRSTRMELNGTSFGGGEGPKNCGKSRQKTDEELKRGSYDRYNHSHFFVSRSASDLMDDEREGGMADRVEREDGLKRRLAQKERERDIAKRLGEIGGGAGKEYMSRAAKALLGSSMSSGSASASALSSRNTSMSNIDGGGDNLPFKRDARALGLVGRKGDMPKVDLGPAKRKRPESSASSSTVSGAGSAMGRKSALGWGSTLSNKLGRMKEGERLDGIKSSVFEVDNTRQPSISSAFASAAASALAAGEAARRNGSQSPVRKKTRFVTEKGIREAGRESLGEPLSAAAKMGRRVVLHDDDDDDDDLIVLK